MLAKKTWTSIQRTLCRGATQLLYPNLCWICTGEVPVDDTYVCAICINHLFNNPHQSCPRCASSVGDFANLEKGCVFCRDASFAFDRAIKMGHYEDVLRDVILEIKHLAGEGLAEVLAQVWAERELVKFEALQADMVIPVPLHWWRKWRRGYNQAETLARVIASRLRLPCRSSYLRRRRNTPPQSLQISPANRRENMRGAFQVRSFANLNGKNVLLIDDVMTTGATAHESAKTLRRAGAASVAVAVLAHGHALAS